MSANPIDINIEMRGLSELENALMELGESVGIKVLKAALREAAKPMLDNARARAPEADQAYYRYTKGRRGGEGKRRLVQPSTLRKSLRLRQLNPSKINNEVDAALTLDVKKDAYYWWMVEKGTATTAAQPFLRPAFDDEYRTVTNNFGEILKKRIDKVKRRQQRGAG